MGQVAKKESQEIATVSGADSILGVIDRAARDPSTDIDKMERLMQMYERMQTKQAEREFAEALAEMQEDLPAIGERGNANGRYTYALWEDINAAIKPILKRYGFALSFRTDCTNGVAVTGVLSHRTGHSTETTVVLPADGSGNKNAVQAVASSVSYGKRYTASALLNLTSHGEDDDAFAAALVTVTDEQAATLESLCEEVKGDKAKFLKLVAKAPSFDLIAAKDYRKCVDMLNKKRGQ